MTNEFFHNNKDKPLVVVSGGAGFIGSFLCELLLQQKCRVICLDDLSTGSKENLSNCLESPYFLLIKQNPTQPIEQKVGEPDYIFHLAGLEAFIVGKDLSFETLMSNIVGTINLLKLAKKTGAKFLLGSSPKVFQARISSQQLAHYFGKGAAAELASFAEAKRSAEAITTEYAEEHKIDARIVRLHWVYGPEMDLRTGDVIARMIQQASAGGPIKIPGDGSQLIRPTFVGDVVYGLTKAMFGSGTSGKIYNLISPKTETLLSFVHQLQNISSRDLSIEFVQEESAFEKEPEIASQDSLNWHPRVELEEGLRQTLSYFEKRIKKETKAKPATKTEKKGTKKSEVREKPSFSVQKGLIFGAIVTLLIIIFFLPGALMANSLLGAISLQSAYQASLRGDFAKTASSAKTAESGFRRAQSNLQSLEPVFTFLGQKGVKDKVETYLTIGLQAGKGVEKLGALAQNVSQISQAVLQDEPVDFDQLTSAMSTDLDAAYEQFSYLEGLMKTRPNSRQFFASFNRQLIENLPTIREMLLQAKKGVVLLPDLAGVYGKKTYLILFQNNMELRPTGGFIGSFALVTFDKGKLIDFQVSDVYSADGQLKGHVEPPEEIKEHLGEAGWYLRDSNFHPDFPISARRAAWFLEKETGRKVNGVIGIDLFLAQRILKAAGPVDLVDYQEEIDADNLFERAEYHAEVNFFPGSTQKKDFLGAVADALFEKVHQTGENQWLALSQAIFQSLKSKDLLVYLDNQEAARILSDLGWDGGLRKVVCQIEEGECLADYLMIVESNFGINKANYFVKRNLTHQVDFGIGGEVRGTLRIEYHNQSQSEIFPAGGYKNYLRILTPIGTKLERVMIDNQELTEDEIKVTEEENKTIIGFLVQVPIQSKKKVEISYQLAERLSTNTGGHYLLYLQKQPGIEDLTYNFIFTPSAKMKVVSTTPQSSQTDELVVFAPKFDQDLVFEVSF